MATKLVCGKLFRVKIHTDKLANPDVTHEADNGEEFFEAGTAYGYGSESDQPTFGDPLVLADGYTLVLAQESDCDDDGNLTLADGLTGDDVTIEPVLPELGYWDSDGTGKIVLADAGTDRFNDMFAVTV